MTDVIFQEVSENLVEIKNNIPVTTSLIVSEKFGKEHKNVLQKIESVVSDMGMLNFQPTPLFEKSEYQSEQNGQYYSVYYMDRDAFTLLVMGFTGKKALEWKLKYIAAFNAMEEKLRSASATPLPDNRLELAKVLSKAHPKTVPAIMSLYPEYFQNVPNPDSLEYISDKNTSYQKWLEDYGITAEWLGTFPTKDIYLNYVRYCTETCLPSLGKKMFFQRVEDDFYVTKKQKADGNRYFIHA